MLRSAPSTQRLEVARMGLGRGDAGAFTSRDRAWPVGTRGLMWCLLFSLSCTTNFFFWRRPRHQIHLYRRKYSLLTTADVRSAAVSYEPYSTHNIDGHRLYSFEQERLRMQKNIKMKAIDAAERQNAPLRNRNSAKFRQTVLHFYFQSLPYHYVQNSAILMKKFWNVSNFYGKDQNPLDLKFPRFRNENCWIFQNFFW